jgi:hypothetical protein
LGYAAATLFIVVVLMVLWRLGDIGVYHVREAGVGQWLLFARTTMMESGFPEGPTADGAGPENALQHAYGSMLAVRNSGDLPAETLAALQYRETVAGGIFPIRRPGETLAHQMDRANNIVGALYGLQEGNPIDLLRNAPLTWVENGVLVTRPNPFANDPRFHRMRPRAQEQAPEPPPIAP